MIAFFAVRSTPALRSTPAFCLHRGIRMPCRMNLVEIAAADCC